MKKLIARPLQLFVLLGLCLTPLYSQQLVSVQRLSQNSSGAGIVGGIGRPVTSPNGRATVFRSDAGNLVAGKTTSVSDIFMVSTESGQVRRINLGPGAQEANGNSVAPAISGRAPGGFYAVAYETLATNLSRNGISDTNGRRDIYFALPTRVNINERASVGPEGVEPDGASFTPSVAVVTDPNKILVAYMSQATNLVEGDTNDAADIFVAEISPPTEGSPFSPATNIVTKRISRAIASGQQPNGPSSAPAISANGSVVVFESQATNLISGLTPTAQQIYLYNIDSDTLTLVSKSASGQPGNGDSSSPSVSYGGKFIVYLSKATNIVSDGVSVEDEAVQIFLYNVATGETRRVNTSAAGEPGNATLFDNISAQVSPNGRGVLFSDASNNLVASDTNGTFDVFVKDMATGAISRVSTSQSGTEANGHSFGTGLGFSNYTSLTALATFLSNADNLIGNDTEDNADAFISTFTFDPVPLSKETTLEVPADVVLDSNRATLSLESFDGVDSSLQSAAAAYDVRAALRKPAVRYFVKAYREGFRGRKRDLRKKLIKRNEITFSKLRSGTYIMQYQARIVRGRRIISRTNMSPPQRVNIDSQE